MTKETSTNLKERVMDIIKITEDELPPEGVNFISVWVYDGYLWSATIRVVNGKLMTYDQEADLFTVMAHHESMPTRTFYIKKGGLHE